MLAKIFAAAFYDLIFVASITAFAIALVLPRISRIYQARVRTGFLVLSLTLLIIYVAHISIMKYLSRPLTYQWIYYSDFLGSLDAKQALLANMNVPLLLVTVTTLIIFFTLRFVAKLTLGMTIARIGPRNTVLGYCAAILLCVALSGWEMQRQKIPYANTAQPLVAFTMSLLGTKSTIFSMEASSDLSHFMPQATAGRDTQKLQKLLLQQRQGTEGTKAGSISPIRNVIFFVMESASAEYFGIYGSELGATPVLDKFRTSSLIVSDAYAHAPATNMSLVSILTGTYPWTAEKLVTAEFPAISLPSISAILKERGYKTAFFSAADLRYQKADQFLAHRMFDVIEDYRTMQCHSGPVRISSKESFSTVGWNFLDGIHDECAVAALNKWIGTAPTDPFFAVLWTQMTHYPYTVDEHEVQFVTDDPDKNRYLNALRIGDRALGRLLDHLNQLNIADSTLVVVLGDHGQAFGRHGDRVHGAAIYEDNLRIPLVLINPSMFSGEVISTVGGIADIPPTIIDLMGIETNAKWQGRSLLDPTRKPFTYFFTPWGELLFGYRDGNIKYLYNAFSGIMEVYDISKDRFESTNIASSYSQRELETIKTRIAAWAQYQNKFVQSQATSWNRGCAQADSAMYSGPEARRQMAIQASEAWSTWWRSWWHSARPNGSAAGPSGICP
jgi:arylsulfatase A-like enzyme/TM2 domain-containing membrane protein YozV